MNFDKLKAEVEALLKAEPAVVVEPAVVAAESTPMDSAQFAAYASEQVAKASAESAEGKADLAKARIEALSAQVELVTKFEFKPGELPAVSIFKDPAQTTHAEISAPSGESTPGSEHWVAKSAEFGQLLASALDALKPAEAPATNDLVPAPAETWPSDLASESEADELRNFKV